MDLKWIGAILIISGCAGFGGALAAAHRREETCLRNLAAALDFMACELQFRITPLPELCRCASRECGQDLSPVFSALAEELDANLSPDVAGCMADALRAGEALPPSTREKLHLLGNSLGRFDLAGQLKGLEAVRAACRRDLEDLSANREFRLRNYQTLSLCAGAALAILLI